MHLQKPKPQATYGRKRKRNILHRRTDDMFFPSDDQLQQFAPAVPPRPPPRSQKEAMAVSEPSDSDIAMVVEMTAADRATAIRYIKAKRNDLNAAMNALLDGEDISKDEEDMTWNEDHFTADRDGGNGDNHLRPLGATAPPSRAPSRNSMHPSTKQDEDEQLKEALRMSREDAPAYAFTQETGTISSTGKEVKFGPATRDYYPSEQWAMVPTSQSASEVVPDADIEDRRNGLGEPRFLKHLPDGDYLPNLLTICHSIAGAREAFLQRDKVHVDYGEDIDWWKGHPISLPKIVHVDSGVPVDEEGNDFEDLIVEVQRLMAFLDQSERSYASVKALAQNNCLQSLDARKTASGTVAELFMEQWSRAVSTADSRGVDESTGMFQTPFASTSIKYTTLIDLTNTAPKGEETKLAELLDAKLWGINVDNVEALSIDGAPADVLVMRLRHGLADVSQLMVDLPTDLFMDKYLAEYNEITEPIRQEIGKERAKIKQLTDLEKRITTRKHPNQDKMIDPRKLLKHTLGMLSGQHEVDDDQATLPNGVSPDAVMVPPEYKKVISQLERAMSSIDKKLAKLAHEKEMARLAIADLSRDPIPEERLKHHYILRGVATKPHITYLLLPKEEEDEDQQMLLDHDSEDNTPEGMQWWRIEYDVTSTGIGGVKIRKSKHADYEVTQAVALEHHTAFVVYASDHINDIIHFNPILPDPLQEFVVKDNLLFQAELQDAVARRPPPAYDLTGDDDDDAMASIPLTSIELRERRDSVDSTRVEGGDDLDDHEDHDLPDYRDPGFENHAAFGLPPGNYEDEPEAPVEEIHLDDEETMPDSAAGARSGGETAVVKEMEMVANPVNPLLSAAGVGAAATADKSELVGEIGRNGKDTGTKHVS